MKVRKKRPIKRQRAPSPADRRRSTLLSVTPPRRHKVTTRLGPSYRTTVFISDELDTELKKLNVLANKVLKTDNQKHYSLAAVLRTGALMYIASETQVLNKTIKGELHAKKRK